MCFARDHFECKSSYMFQQRVYSPKHHFGQVVITKYESLHSVFQNVSIKFHIWGYSPCHSPLKISIQVKGASTASTQGRFHQEAVLRTHRLTCQPRKLISRSCDMYIYINMIHVYMDNDMFDRYVIVSIDVQARCVHFVHQNLCTSESVE